MVSNGADHQLDEPIPVGDRRLTLHDIVLVARDYHQVQELSPFVERRVEESAAWVRSVVEDIELKRQGGKREEVKPFYGINTGFGANAGKAALRSEYLTRVLSRNLIASHSVGVGSYFDEEIVRAAILIRAHTLAQGYSGVRPLVIEKLITMLNRRVYPCVPSKGSMGSSGDLAPLSHLVLAMCCPPTPGPEDEEIPLDPTSGEAFVPVTPGTPMSASDSPSFHVTSERVSGAQTLWRRASGEEAMAVAGGQIELLAKEGVALNNGATFSGAIAALTLYDAWNLVEHSELALSMTLEAFGGFRDPFFPELHEVRGHPGAKVTAANVLRYIDGSDLVDPGDRSRDPQRLPPQDFYSLRCAPQVLGTVRDTLEFVQRITDTEINAVTDNPLIFLDLPRSYKTVSGGNFHGEPVAMAMDFLGIAITELGNIAERRIFQLTSSSFSRDNERGDNFLIREKTATEGLNSGLMLSQYAAGALVSDCKTLAHPDSVDSIPSSANKEDHVSMSTNAARHAREIVDNIEAVVAIEFMCAAQALSLRLQGNGNSEGSVRLGAGTGAAWRRIRDEVDYLAWDRVLYPDIRALIQLIRSGDLVRLAHAATHRDAHIPSGGSAARQG